MMGYSVLYTIFLNRRFPVTAKLRKRLDLELFLLPIFGRDPEGDVDDDDTDEEEDRTPKPRNRSRTNRRKTEDDDDEDPDDLDGIEDPKERRIAELSRENARRRRERNAERKEKEALAARIAELEKTGKSAEDQIKTEAETLKSENARLQKLMSKSTLRTAISSNDTYKWYNIDDAIRELNMEDLDIDIEHGEVDGLEAQLKKIAKNKPYLLKKSEQQDEDNASGGNQKPGGFGRTGINPSGSQRQKSSQLTQREALIKKYRVLGESQPV